MEEDNRKLKVSIDDGRELEINVVDIFPVEKFNKEYIIYTIGKDEDTFYASILNEDDTSFSLNTIESDEEFAYINELLKKYQEE